MLVDDEGVSATFDHVGALPLGLRIALDEAASRGDRPELVRVHTQDGAALPDLESWTQELRVHFERGGDWAQLSRGPVGHDALDVMHGMAARRARRAVVSRAAVALGLAILVLQAALTVADDVRLGHERDALEAQREAIFVDGDRVQLSPIGDPQRQAVYRWVITADRLTFRLLHRTAGASSAGRLVTGGFDRRC
jgi:hypothetical protein